MKKALSLILVLVLCLSLCACGQNEEVKNALIRETWDGTLDTDFGYVSYTINFSYDGQARVDRSSSTRGSYTYDGDYIPGIQDVKTYNGPYTIESDQIIISDSGMDFFIDYTFNNGELTLTLVVDGDRIPLGPFAY